MTTYLVILKNELKWTIDLYFKDFKGVIFQQDGAGPHRAKVVKSTSGGKSTPFSPGQPTPPTFHQLRTSGPT